MDRRKFISISATSLAGLALFGIPGVAFAKDASKGPRKYSVVILGDTHFDTEPDTVYHSNYNEPVEWLNRVQRAEFARNGEMRREKAPCDSFCSCDLVLESAIAMKIISPICDKINIPRRGVSEYETSTQITIDKKYPCPII